MLSDNSYIRVSVEFHQFHVFLEFWKKGLKIHIFHSLLERFYISHYFSKALNRPPIFLSLRIQLVNYFIRAVLRVSNLPERQLKCYCIQYGRE